MTKDAPLFPRVRLVTPPRPAAAIAGLVYSTRPRISLASNGERYFLKGPDPDVVAAECIGYALAGATGLPTPQPALTRDPETNEILFACRELRVRGIDLVEQSVLYSNSDFWGDLIAFDIWIANPDRNHSNVLAEPDGGRHGESVRLHAIDFEKSRVCRSHSALLVNTASPSEWWPKETLARLLPPKIPLPKQMMARITEVGATRARDLVRSLLMDSVGITEFDRLAHHIESRAARIEDLVTETWNARPR